MIIYIHGFGSSGHGHKAMVLREELKDLGLIAPSLQNVPELAVSTLCELIEAFQKHEPVYLIGSSLGGYYAIYLAEKYALPAVLINPAIRPYELLHRALGHPSNYYDLSTYEWRETHLQMLKRFEVSTPDPKRYLLLLQTGDEVLDYRDALAKVPGAEQIVEEGGDHGFAGVERYGTRIRNFFDAWEPDR